MTDRFANVAPALPLSPRGPQSYTYRLPPTAPPAAKYSVVTVPFGRRYVSGIVTSLHRRRPPFPAKPISSVSAVSLTREQFLFAQWLAKTMHGGLGYTLRLFRPPQLIARAPASYRIRSGVSPSTKLLAALASGATAIIDYRARRRLSLIKPLIAHYTHRQHQVLTIVPEISLLDGPGLPYHAGLRPSVITSIWHGVKTGQVRAIRGTQKALFLPWHRLGLIIVAEEQNPAHKLWDQYPRLDNLDAVRELSRLHRCPVLYLSSFPSWRLSQGIENKDIITIVNHPLPLKTNYLPFSFSDKINKYPLPHALLQNIRRWSSAKQQILLLYNRLNNQKIMQTLQTNLSSAQMAYCHLATSRVFASSPTDFDRLVWLFPEQTINIPDYRSVENAHLTVSRLHQLGKARATPVYLVTRQLSKVEQAFQDPDAARQQDLRLRARFLLPPFASQIRLRISATKPALASRQARQIFETIQTRINQLPSPSASSLLLRGPYKPLIPSRPHSHLYILLRGPIDLLPDLYADLPIDSAELTPHRLF